jgi:2-polyprenyl-6-methoxyphenol hydroxylase-like FAD-dependent oxidoreductase
LYDVIIVGSRVAGAATALLLARQGLKVLCVDQSTFPSDTLSSHLVQIAGVARLKRWGLLDKIVAIQTPAVRKIRYDTGTAILEGCPSPLQEVDALYAPRRTILDKVLVDAARASGAEVREGAIVEGLADRDGRIAGIVGRTAAGRSFNEFGRLIVGADGKRSLVARFARSEVYYERPLLSAAYYWYYDGLDVRHCEAYERPRRYIAAWPTNGGSTVIYLALALADYQSFRNDVAGNFLKTLDCAGDLGDRVRAARPVDKPRGSAQLPNRFRKPFGPGWALVGDAGAVMDPLTGQGISHALRDAEFLSDAIVRGLGGTQDLACAMRAYERERNRQTLPIYKLTLRLANMIRRPWEIELLYASIADQPAEIDAMFGVLTGSVTLSDFSSPGHLLRMIKPRALAAIGWRRFTETISTLQR